MPASPKSSLPPFDPTDPLGLDDLLEPEDLAVRDTVRGWAADRVLPHIAEWYEKGELPAVRELARELGELGALGMSLSGYGCAGASAVQYGLACLELEAADSGIRSLCPCRARWPCTPSTATAARSRSSSGCRGWRPAR
jgi:glutaryl-CoA dehydrogenase